MKAIVHHVYGSPEVLELKDIAQPTIGDDQVLVRVRAASINPYDWHLLTGQPYVMRLHLGLRRPPRIGVGIDLAGHVHALGRNVAQWRTGDAVYGGLADQGSHGDSPSGGTLAEYVCVPENLLTRKPERLTFEQAAAVPVAGWTALQALRDWGGLQSGQHVLINGASGGVGTFAVQIAKALGAEVTGVCSRGNVASVRCLGADHVVDYTCDDFTRGQQRYDVILDNVGNRSLSENLRVLKQRGTYIASFGQPEHRWFGPMLRLLHMSMMSPFISQRLVQRITKPSRDDLLTLNRLIEAGKVTPVVDRTYPLEEASSAMRYLENGHVRGKVVVTV